MRPSTLNDPQPSLRPFNHWLVVVPVVVGLVAYFSFLVRNYELDDALIYYRYIHDVLAGHGLVYNVGERFNALTSPLHTYLSIAVCGLAGSIRYPMIVLSAMLTATAALGLFALYMPAEPRWPAIAFGAALLAGMRYSYSVYGMETPLFLVLCVACLWLYERRRIFSLGIAAALLILTRGEAVLLIAVLCAVHLVRHRPLPHVRDFIAPFLLLAGNAAFDFIYYGSPLPHTLMAKIQQGRSGLWGGRWLFFSRRLPDRVLRREPRALRGLLGVGDPRGFPPRSTRSQHGRLGVPGGSDVVLRRAQRAQLSLVLRAVLCVREHVRRARIGEICDLTAKLRVPTLIQAGQAVAVLAGAGILGLNAYATQMRPMIDVERQELYPRIGLWLARNTPSEASVAMVEVGIIGYYSERRVVDILGLVSPKNAESLGEGRLDEWLLRYDPDFILVHAPIWPHEEGVIGAVQQGRYRVSGTFGFPGFELLERKD
jgi:hypothetical protein